MLRLAAQTYQKSMGTGGLVHLASLASAVARTLAAPNTHPCAKLLYFYFTRPKPTPQRGPARYKGNRVATRRTGNTSGCIQVETRRHTRARA